MSGAANITPSGESPSYARVAHCILGYLSRFVQKAQLGEACRPEFFNRIGPKRTPGGFRWEALDT